MKNKNLLSKLRFSNLRLNDSKINLYRNRLANIQQNAERDQNISPSSNPSQGGGGGGTQPVDPSSNNYVVDGYIDNYFV